MTMTPRLLYYKPRNRLSQSDHVVLDRWSNLLAQFLPLLGIDVVHDDVGVLQIVHIAAQVINHAVVGEPQGTVTHLFTEVTSERQDIDLETGTGIMQLFVTCAAT